MWDFCVKDQRAFSPLRSLVCEAVTAIPPTGGAVTALLTVRVGVVVAAILDVSWTVNHDGTCQIRSPKFRNEPIKFCLIYLQGPRSFRQSSPSRRQPGTIHSLSQEPSPNLSLHFLLTGHWPHGFSDAVERKYIYIYKIYRENFLNKSTVFVLIVFILLFCGSVFSDQVLAVFSLRYHNCFSDYSSSSCDRRALIWDAGGTGNSPDINRKFPGEMNSNRKWCGLSLNKVEGHLHSNQGYDGVGQWGLAGVCRNNLKQRSYNCQAVELLRS